MDTKPASSGHQQHGGGDGGHSAAVARAEAVRLWEALFDEDTDLARALFFDAMLRDAKADYDSRDKDDEGAFEPWQPPSGDPVPPPSPPQVERTVVLGLCAPRHLAPRKHGRAPPGVRRPEPEGVKKPRVI